MYIFSLLKVNKCLFTFDEICLHFCILLYVLIYICLPSSDSSATVGETVFKSEERPTPAARTSTPSSASSTSERTKKGKASTIISIGASAPLVSPEADIEKEVTNVKAIYIKASTEDESTTDPPDPEVLSPPPPPPRPSKASGSSSASSSVEASPKHVLANTRLNLSEDLGAVGGDVKAAETVSVASHGGPARELSELSLQDDETSRGFSSQQWGE